MFKSKNKYRKPRISANKLGEYIHSAPHRRKEIVKNQKYPKGYVVTRYNDAKSTIIDFFINGRGDKGLVEKKIKDLIQRSYASNFRTQDNALSIEALEIFKGTNLADLEGYSLNKFNRGFQKLSVQGVEVAVEPEILIKGSVRGVDFVGAIKIHISKSHPLTSDSGKYVASLIHSFLEKNYSGVKVRPDFCISLDIFTGTYFSAPRSFKLLRKEIEAACNEIRLIWNSL
jgi:hypothetical protein